MRKNTRITDMEDIATLNIVTTFENALNTNKPSKHLKVLNVYFYLLTVMWLLLFDNSAVVTSMC